MTEKNVHSVVKNSTKDKAVKKEPPKENDKMEDNVTRETRTDEATEQVIPVAEPIPAELMVEETVSIPVKEVPLEENHVEPALEEPVYCEPSNSGGYVGTYSVTAYTWTGNTMANGEYPYYGSAASCDFSLGTTLYIEGVGTFVVNDVCPTSGVIDIYMDSYDACIQFGRISADVYIQ